jgi:hypothetical protein
MVLYQQTNKRMRERKEGDGMRRLRRAVLIVLLMGLLGLTASAEVTEFGASSVQGQYVVASDGTYSAVVTMTLRFTGADTSITLPLGEDVTSASADGYETKLSRDENGVCVLKLTTSGFLVPGSVTVRYTGELPMDTDDELTTATLGLLCAQWPGTVSDVSFRITMPETVPHDAAVLVSGYYGELSGDAITLTYTDNVINGTFSGELLDHESLTLSLTVPEGYFDTPAALKRLLSPIHLVVPLLWVLCLLYWFFTLRSPRGRVRARVQKLPPDGVCAGDVPYLLYGKKPDMVLTVAQWASLGYLTIFTGRGVTLSRRMGMGNERKGYERRLFRAIFSISGTAPGARVKTEADDVRGAFDAHWRSRIFDRTSGSPHLLRTVGVAAVWFAALRVGLAVDQFTLPHWLLGILLSVVGALGGWMVCIGCTALRTRRNLPRMIAGGVSLAALLLLGGLAELQLAVLLACVLAGFTGWVTAWGGRRTRAGSDLLARLLGLRRFLTGAEEKQLRRMLRQDPQYFYTLLPFAEALGVGKRFARRFGNAQLEPCDWYQTRKPLRTAAGFRDSFSQTMDQMRK